MKLVSIITVNFNHSELTEAMLASIAATNDYENIEIIVVDNASTINPVPGWTLKYTGATFIRSEENLGFAGGNNLGVLQAKGAYLFFVNNDTEFTPGLVQTLVQLLDAQPQVGVVSPKILYWDNKAVLQYAGYTEMNYVTARNRCIGLLEKDEGQYDNKTGPTAFAHGAAMMVRRKAIEKTGLMAENFFLYYEEFDWFERIKKAGFSIWVCMEAVIYHKESMSVGKQSALKEYYMNRNRILFIRRNAGPVKTLLFFVYFFLVVTPRNVLQYIRQKNRSFIKELFKAIRWNLANGVNSANR
jgi:GT2 family glycosyltransferase